MPQPTMSDVHVNRPLTDMSFAYMSDLEFVADKVFPNIPVQSKSDMYYTYPKDAWLRIQAKKRAPGTESAGSGYDLSTDTYTCDVIALHKDIDDQVRSNADPVINLDAEAARWLAQQLALKREYDFASKFFATGQWTGTSSGSDITPSNRWDTANGNPIADFSLQMDSMQAKTGLRPTKAVFGKRAWQVVKDNAAVIDRIKYTSGNDNPTIATQQAFAKLVGLEEVLVAGAVQNTANEGAAANVGFMYTGDSVLLVHAPKSPGIMTPSAGYTFSWQQYLAAANGVRMSRFRMDPLRSDRIEGEMAYAMKLVAADLGCLFVNVDT